MHLAVCVRKTFEGRGSTCKAIASKPANKLRYLQNKPHFFLGAVAEEGATTTLNPRHLIHSYIHSFIHSAAYSY